MLSFRSTASLKTKFVVWGWNLINSNWFFCSIEKNCTWSISKSERRRRVFAFLVTVKTFNVKRSSDTGNMPRFWICKTNGFRRNSLENIDVVQMHGVHSGEYYLKPGLDARSPPDKRDWRAVRSQQRSSGQAQVWSQNGTGWNLWKKDHSILNNHLLALRYFWVNFTKPVKNMS